MAVQDVREMKDLVLNMAVDVMNDRKLDDLSKYYIDDCVTHFADQRPDTHGIEGVKTNWEDVFQGFPDFMADLDHVVAEGDKICGHFTYKGTHDGEFLGMEPTNKAAKISGMTMYRFEDGKIAESWVHTDFLGLMQQLGLAPMPGEQA
ncbi:MULTISPECIES: ester cyclase [unclassified Haladaptatus]|uniref:ester cyclase n=2 Tax=Haladaptatus TaxID=367188 RepID=UPI0023E79BF7|nr:MULTISPECIES: ester cyclase [unclassified Haladaptatus]